MSASQIELGSDVASALRLVQRRLGWRGIRVPLAMLPGGFGVWAAEVRFQVLRARLPRKRLSEVALVLRALESYFIDIGACFDAARMRDMRTVVDSCLAQ